MDKKIDIHKIYDDINPLCPACGAKKFAMLLDEYFAILPRFIIILKAKCLFCGHLYDIVFTHEEVKKHLNLLHHKGGGFLRTTN